jgi:glycosyltransferase involved in cell wall biosynthesis
MLAGREELHLVLAASTANPADDSLRNDLEQAGIEIHHEYLPHIEDLYRASDLYLFPVRAGSGSIEFPLSVMEAMACNLPVVATPFGALPEHFAPGDGLQYFQTMQDLPAAIDAALSERADTRTKVRSFSWEAGMEQLMAKLSEAMNS